MRCFLMLVCAGLALVIGVSAAQAGPPPDAKAVKERLRQLWRDYYDALAQDSAAKAAAHPEDAPCRH